MSELDATLLLTAAAAPRPRVAPLSRPRTAARTLGVPRLAGLARQRRRDRLALVRTAATSPTSTRRRALTSIGRITGLLGAYLALAPGDAARAAARARALVGFDRLTVWHRWNGHACLDLVLAHVVFTVWGYALLDKLLARRKEISTMLGGGIYPGMITATVGTALLIAVVVDARS